MLRFNGDWEATLDGYDGTMQIVIDDSCRYSRHSHFVQALKRYAGPEYKVWSTMGDCFIVSVTTVTEVSPKCH